LLAVLVGALAVGLHAARPGTPRVVAPRPAGGGTSVPQAEAPQAALRVVSETSAAVRGQPEVLRLTSVYAAGRRQAWVAGMRDWVPGSPCAAPCTGFVAATDDGGRSWRRTDLGDMYPDELGFADPEHGWLLASTVGECSIAQACVTTLLRTDDGGRTWRRWLQTSAYRLQDLQFVGGDVGFAIRLPVRPCSRPGGCAELVRTDDGGRTWTAVEPRGPVPQAFRFADDRNGWILGAACEPAKPCRVGIFATTDGGRIWLRQLETDVPAGQGGGSLDVTDPLHGWALIGDTRSCTMGGCWGELYRTEDGGQTWERLQSANRWATNPVQAPPGFPGTPRFTDAATGWIPIQAGAGPGIGGVARTADGGRTWARFGADRLWSISAVAPVDARTAWAVGSRHGQEGTTSFVVRTDDGGRTWDQALPALRPTGAVDFVSPTLGFGIGLPSDPGALLESRDGGVTWSPVGRWSGWQLSALRFVDAVHGWVVADSLLPSGPRWRLLRTRDGGRSWQVLPAPSDVADDAVVYLRFFDPERGLRITRRLGAGRETLALATTSDGGDTWTQGPTAAADVEFVAADFPTPRRGWLVTFLGQTGYALRATEDGGATWTEVAVLPLRQYQERSVSFPSASTGWVADGSRLLATSDGGRSWRALNLGALRPRALAFADGRHGWMLDERGGLYRTADGGASWDALP
jgi:photosystem II stability/assembly factor-like uncharacterized protein